VEIALGGLGLCGQHGFAHAASRSRLTGVDNRRRQMMTHYTPLRTHHTLLNVLNHQPELSRTGTPLGSSVPPVAFILPIRPYIADANPEGYFFAARRVGHWPRGPSSPHRADQRQGWPEALAASRADRSVALR